MTRTTIIAALLTATLAAGCSFSFDSGKTANSNANASNAPKSPNVSKSIDPTPTRTESALPAPAAKTTAPNSAESMKVDVRFPKGETGADFNDTVVPGATHTYVVNLRQGQYLGVQTYSAGDDDDDVTFKIRRKGGSDLEVPAGDTKWGGDVPASGDYEIVIKGAAKAIKYKISIHAE